MTAYYILVVSMLAPWSYRRAYVVELQCHSSKVCLYFVLRTCVDVGEILVEPGQKLKIRSVSFTSIFVLQMSWLFDVFKSLSVSFGYSL